MQNVFKLFDSFDPLIFRETIRSQIEKKISELFAMFSEDLDIVRRIFVTQRDNPPMHDNMPSVSGMLSWSRALLDRIVPAMQKIQQLAGASNDSDEARELVKKHKALVTELTEFEQSRHKDWTARYCLHNHVPIMVLYVQYRSSSGREVEFVPSGS